MKHLLTALVLTVFSLTACAKEEKSLPPVEVIAPASVTKQVCVTQLDSKTKKEKQVCRNIKIHKKLEGKKLEDAKKEDKKK